MFVYCTIVQWGSCSDPVMRNIIFHVSTEIASQPQNWARAAELALQSSALFPSPGERVAIVGCGTSWFIAQSYAALRESAGLGVTDAFAASESLLHSRQYDRVIVISRSGTTTEVLELMSSVTPGTRLLALTSDAQTPIVNMGAESIVLDFAEERSVVQTRFATSALALLRASLGENLELAIAAAERAVVQPLSEEWLDAEQFTFLGRGWSIGIATEAGLKMREAAQMWTESYPAMEYRHGPISIAAPNRVVWSFGTHESGLRSDVAATGAVFVEHLSDPMADLILVQRLAVQLAVNRGLDADNPRSLTRAVILTGR